MQTYVSNSLTKKKFNKLLDFERLDYLRFRESEKLGWCHIASSAIQVSTSRSKIVRVDSTQE
jgi:hypothetical protein